MASVTRYGLPDVAPSATVPYQRIDSKVGEAVSQLGAAVQARGRQIADQDTETNAKAADAALVGALNETYMGEGGIGTLQGKAAVDAAPGALATARAHAQRIAEGLSGDAGRMFQDAAAVRINQFTQNVYVHAAQERQQWVVNTNVARAEVALNDINLYYNDNARVRQNMQLGVAAIHDALTAQGAPPEQIEAATQKWLGEAEKTRLGAMPVDQRIAILTGSPTGRIQGSTIAESIHMQESGGATSGRILSSAGAVGPMQIMPATFARYAHAGEDINNPADNITVGKRIIENYSNRPGWDAARVAVAYYSGEHNVAPPGSPTPWLRNTSYGGKTVASYTADVLGRLGGQEPMTAPEDGLTSHILPSDKQALLYTYQAQARVDTYAQEHAERAAAQATSNDLYSHYIKGDLTIPMIMGAPGIDYTVRKQFVDMLQTTAGGVRTSPALFNELYQRVNLPPGDPRRIESTYELQAYAARGLLGPEENTKLRNEIEGRDKPGNETERVLQEGLFKQARVTIVGGGLLSGPNPVGEARLQAFTTWYLQQRDAMRAKGINVADWMNPANPDSPDKQIPNFTVPLQDMIKDMTARLTPPETAPISPLTPTVPQLLRALPPGTLTYNAARQQWRNEATGQVYDFQGKPVPQ